MLKQFYLSQLNTIFISLGLIMILAGSINLQNVGNMKAGYDAVEAEVVDITVDSVGMQRNFHAHVNYDYDGKHYEDVVMETGAGVNIGDTATLYVLPAQPDMAYYLDGNMLVYRGLIYGGTMVIVVSLVRTIISFIRFKRGS